MINLMLLSRYLVVGWERCSTLDRWTHACSTSATMRRGRGVRYERPEDTASQEAWDASRLVEQGLHWLGTRGFMLVEQLLLPASGHWRQWDAWPECLKPPREAYDSLLQVLYAVVSPEQLHTWGTPPLGCIRMPGPQMLPLEWWFPVDTDSLWAWHDQRRMDKLGSMGAISSQPLPLPTRRRCSRWIPVMTMDEGCFPPPALVGVITGREDSRQYTLQSGANSLPRVTTMVNQLDDSTLATQLCAVRALIPVPSTWLETDWISRACRPESWWTAYCLPAELSLARRKVPSSVAYTTADMLANGWGCRYEVLAVFGLLWG